jgi:hypothetical protein
MSTRTLTVNCLVSGRRRSKTRPVVGTLIDTSNIFHQRPSSRATISIVPKRESAMNMAWHSGGFPRSGDVVAVPLKHSLILRTNYLIAASRPPPFHHHQPLQQLESIPFDILDSKTIVLSSYSSNLNHSLHHLLRKLYFPPSHSLSNSCPSISCPCYATIEYHNDICSSILSFALCFLIAACKHSQQKSSHSSPCKLRRILDQPYPPIHNLPWYIPINIR